MHRPSTLRALKRTATAAALAAAVTVPTLASAPAFASSDHHWYYDSSYVGHQKCNTAGHNKFDHEHTHWTCYQDKYDHGNWWDLYYWA